MSTDLFLKKVVEIYFRDNCSADEAIIKAKEELKLSDNDFDVLVSKLKESIEI